MLDIDIRTQKETRNDSRGLTRARIEFRARSGLISERSEIEIELVRSDMTFSSDVCVGVAARLSIKICAGTNRA